MAHDYDRLYFQMGKSNVHKWFKMGRKDGVDTFVEERDKWTRQSVYRVNTRIQFAKIDATEEDPNDYGRSLGVRFKVMKIPSLRLYWRYGRRGGKISNQPEPDKIFDWV